MLNDYQSYKNYIKADIWDINDNIDFKNVLQFDSKIYRFVNYNKNLRTGQIDCDLTEILNSDVTYSLSVEEILSTDGTSTGGSSSGTANNPTGTTVINNTYVNGIADLVDGSGTTWNPTLKAVDLGGALTANTTITGADTYSLTISGTPNLVLGATADLVILGGPSIWFGNTGTTGTSRTISAIGSETNIDFVLSPKGTGKIIGPSGMEANISNDQDIVNKAYADSVAGTTYTFANGLTEAAGTAKLGGALTGNTIIDADDTYNITFDNFVIISGSSTNFSGQVKFEIDDGFTGKSYFNLSTGGGDFWAYSVGASHAYSGVSVAYNQAKLFQRNETTGADEGYVLVNASGVNLLNTPQANGSTKLLLSTGDPGIIQTIDVSSTIGNTPAVGQDGYVVYWDNGNTRFDLKAEAAATTYTFANGLTEAAGTAKLGGALTGNTIIDLSAYYLHLNANTAGYPRDEIYLADNSIKALHYDSATYYYGITIDNNSIQLGLINTSAVEFTMIQITDAGVMWVNDDINSVGLKYAGDYEANFVARSLVTKQFVTGYLPLGPLAAAPAAGQDGYFLKWDNSNSYYELSAT